MERIGSGGRGRWVARLAGLALSLGASLGLTGCQFFFQCAKSSCTDNTTTTTSTNNSGDYAYVSNSATGSGTYVSEYNIGSGTLATISGSPFNLGYEPVAMKVSPNNSFLYVGSGQGGIYLYTISSTGVLAQVGSGAQILTTTGSISSLDISPDGYWLFAMDQTGALLSEYALNTSTGTLMGPNTFQVPGSSGCVPVGATVVSQSCTVQVSPISNGSGYVAVALGSAGTVVYPYTTSGGMVQTSVSSIPCCNPVVGTTSGDFSLAFDSNDYLYIARTNALSSYGYVGTTAPVNDANQIYGAQVTPRSVTLSRNGAYVYTANEGAGTISGFTLSGMAQMSPIGLPVTGPSNVSALAADNTGTYLIAVGYNGSNGVQLFKPSSGALGTAVASAATGTSGSVPALVALTH